MTSFVGLAYRFRESAHDRLEYGSFGQLSLCDAEHKAEVLRSAHEESLMDRYAYTEGTDHCSRHAAIRHRARFARSGQS